MMLLTTLYRPVPHSIENATFLVVVLAQIAAIALVARGMRYLEFRSAVQRLVLGALVAVLIPVAAFAEDFIMRDPCELCRVNWPEWVCWLWMCF